MIKTGGGVGKPMPVVGQVVPFGDFAPGFCFKLGFCVGGYNDFRVGPRGHEPVDNPRNSGGLADPAARPYGNARGAQGIFFDQLP